MRYNYVKINSREYVCDEKCIDNYHLYVVYSALICITLHYWIALLSTARSQQLSEIHEIDKFTPFWENLFFNEQHFVTAQK